MKQNVNYIEHHRSVNFKLSEDDLTSIHISLYNALFLIWNECGFDTELSINRNDIMKLSKIGSANTYTKALKELDEKGYLKYKPSFNPLIGSKISLYRFDNGINKGSVKGGSKGTDNGSDTLSKQLNNETIKLLNEQFENFENKDKWNELWNRWVKYKYDQHKDKYKSKDSEKTAIEKLIKISNKDYNIALQIIENSISSAYKGFFELKNKTINNITNEISSR